MVFTDSDPRWRLYLRVLSVKKPVWFLKEGEITCFCVHSPGQVFGVSGYGAAGKEYKFAIRISRSLFGGGLHYSPPATRHSQIRDPELFPRPRPKK